VSGSLASEEESPDHSSLTKIRQHLSLFVHKQVFAFVLQIAETLDGSLDQLWKFHDPWYCLTLHGRCAPSKTRGLTTKTSITARPSEILQNFSV